jgi:hypothetical protein
MLSTKRWLAALMLSGLALATQTKPAQAVTYDSPQAYSGKNKTGMSTGQPLVIIQEKTLGTSPGNLTVIDKRAGETFGNSLWGAGYSADFKAYADRLSSPARNQVRASASAKAWGTFLEQRIEAFSFTASAKTVSDGSRSASYQLYVLGQQVDGKSQSGGPLKISTPVGSSIAVSPPITYMFMISVVPVTVKGQVYMSKGVHLGGNLDVLDFNATFEPYARLYGELRVDAGIPGVVGAGAIFQLSLVEAELPITGALKWTTSSRANYGTRQLCRVDQVTGLLDSRVAIGTLDGTIDLSVYVGPFKHTERIAEWDAPFTSGFYLFGASTEAKTAPYACTALPKPPIGLAL